MGKKTMTRKKASSGKNPSAHTLFEHSPPKKTPNLRPQPSSTRTSSVAPSSRSVLRRRGFRVVLSSPRHLPLSTSLSHPSPRHRETLVPRFCPSAWSSRRPLITTPSLVARKSQGNPLRQSSPSSRRHFSSLLFTHDFIFFTLLFTWRSSSLRVSHRQRQLSSSFIVTLSPSSSSVAVFSVPRKEEGQGGRNWSAWDKWSNDGTGRQVAKLMEENVGAAMQFLQSKALCIMSISQQIH
ncbi:hypothetical protein PIB30_097985 [Stylosanthes scabra]|uniref:Uncharacterized protein n=1 Tax=Stylosanthes scabra TaxID=79078 RepID=A0ABU6ZV41_9FABA|nr:hypothetical protein [Stylosanthes scabra]